MITYDGIVLAVKMGDDHCTVNVVMFLDCSYSDRGKEGAAWKRNCSCDEDTSYARVMMVTV